jgi:rubrerythrin
MSLSCDVNLIDNLLNEAEKIISEENFIELQEQFNSNDTSLKIKATAKITRLTNIVQELENHQKDMSVGQLEKIFFYYCHDCTN